MLKSDVDVDVDVDVALVGCPARGRQGYIAAVAVLIGKMEKQNGLARPELSDLLLITHAQLGRRHEP